MVEKLVFRHSVTSWRSFHFLASDLDATLVISEETSLAEESSLVALAESVRNSFPFVGEIEIYRRSEFEHKELIEREIGEIFDATRSIRKFGWIKNDPEAGFSAYHREKQTRSLEKIEEKIVEAEEVLSRKFPAEALLLKLDPNFVTSSRDYLGEIGLSKLSAEAQKLAMLAVPSISEKETRTELTQFPQLAFLRLLLLEHEAIVALGRARYDGPLGSEKVEELTNWSAMLRKEAQALRLELLDAGYLLRIDCYGASCDVLDLARSPHSREILRELAKDFSFFESRHELSFPSCTVLLENDDVSRTGWKSVEWTDGPLVQFTTLFDKRLASFRRLHESVDYVSNFIQSSLGETLEKRGWFRIHAAGLFENGELQLWNAQPGAGKSTRTLHHLFGTSNELYGDEQVMIKDGVVYPFPLPVAVDAEEKAFSSRTRKFLGSRKILHRISSERVGKPTRHFKVRFVTERKSFAKSQFMFSFTLGLGLPQMREYMIRKDNLAWLANQATRRLRYASTLWSSGQVEATALQHLRELDFSTQPEETTESVNRIDH